MKIQMKIQMKKIDYSKINCVRMHNKQESLKHFIAKAICVKILFENNYQIFTEFNTTNNWNKGKVCDVFAEGKKKSRELSFVIELESKPTNKKNKELMDYYAESYNLIIIDISKLSEDLEDMYEEIKYKLGLK
jgi:hypothetical protein